ncbi:hypothetical protein AYI69_g7230 [Smittium culicis]|uniref:Uncharacterized protein n=1 Tax=Smittium culicis TaxID=133412 RepID=A0A1R1XTI2_9FUNG|nr:hypothetical protein AYI69_g7230 [Smittium culicis]
MVIADLDVYHVDGLCDTPHPAKQLRIDCVEDPLLARYDHIELIVVVLELLRRLFQLHVPLEHREKTVFLVPICTTKFQKISISNIIFMVEGGRILYFWHKKLLHWRVPALEIVVYRLIPRPETIDHGLVDRVPRQSHFRARSERLNVQIQTIEDKMAFHATVHVARANNCEFYHIFSNEFNYTKKKEGYMNVQGNDYYLDFKKKREFEVFS